MRVSINLCTKNGGSRLQACLDAIELLNVPSGTELLLVDNGSTDGVSYERLQAFGARTRFRCHVLQTFTPGNSAGRNLALRHATGDLQLFIDDDCYVDREFVRDWLEVFARQPGLGYASGMVTPHDRRYSMMGCTEQATEEPVPAGHFARRGLIQGSNMAFTRACLDAVGGFDERFGAGTPFAGEEWDVALRASAKGWSGGYFPGPRVAHDHRRTEDEGRERLLYYDYGAGAVYAKNTFRMRGRIFSSYTRELRWLEHDRPRRAMLLRGYRDFAALAARRAA
jgi:GT2 family glycosyltransferase